MTGAYLPGDSTVELRAVVRMKASTLWGGDIRCIYHEHLGKGPEGYRRAIAP